LRRAVKFSISSDSDPAAGSEDAGSIPGTRDG
jgi:hypothetical protein